MDKNILNELMMKAEEVLQRTDCKLFKRIDGVKSDVIYDNFNGQISALGVSILMIGLKPTVAVYYQDDKGSDDKGCRRDLLREIYKMTVDNANNFDGWVREILRDNTDSKKQKIQDCSVALKYIIRTHKLG
jgi:hypothetical protein